jgi:hypothetical protein
MSDTYCGYCGNRVEGRHPFCPYCSATDGEPPAGLVQMACRLTPDVRREIDDLALRDMSLDDARRALAEVYARRFNELT